MSGFDPFTATMEDAQAHPDAYAVRGAIWRVCGAQMLMARRNHYEAHPLDGIAVCVTHDLLAPDWLARSFLAAKLKVTWFKARNWDEAFGPAHPKGVNLAAQRRSAINRIKVANLFAETLQREPWRAVDKSLWSEIGRAVGEGATRSEELYREALSRGFALGAADIRKRAGVRVRPAKSPKLAGIRRSR
jgi:hypothetical protein